MITKTPTSTDSAGVFSAPRKFDLSTILVVTTAYAAVFALMRAISFSAMAFLFVSAFITSVALGQAILFRAKHPRWASTLAGSVFFVIGLLAWSVIGQHGPPPSPMIVFSLITGAFWGYIGGVLVGFVFMVAHGVRLLLSRDSSGQEILDE